MTMLTKPPPKKIPSSSSKKTPHHSINQNISIPNLILPNLSETKAPVSHVPVESGIINTPKEAKEVTSTTYPYWIQYQRKIPSGNADTVDLIKIWWHAWCSMTILSKCFHTTQRARWIQSRPQKTHPVKSNTLNCMYQRQKSTITPKFWKYNSAYPATCHCGS